MAVLIKDVQPGSLAEKAGIRSGQMLVEINGHQVEDVLDYQFYIHDEKLSLIIKESSGETKHISFHKAFEADLGIELLEIRSRACKNKCIFCFVDQLPAQVRKSLRFKDEDYRLSFLRGNYITMTDLSKKEIDRIIRQRLSPLYISVHSTDEDVRRRLLGRRETANITEMISKLAKGGIQLHCQLVVCPGINDGYVLWKSVEDLSRFFPAIQSVAVVPVGLTGHRDSLPKIKPVGPEQARVLIQEGEVWHACFRRSFGQGFIYLADEIFLMGRNDLPPKEYYDGFPQLENGVGMVRHFMDEFERRQATYPARLHLPRSITLITGSASASLIRDVVVKRLSQMENLEVELVVVQNRFFGGGVSVSGLLAGSDILEALRENLPRGTAILPPDCLNAEGLFLDDLSVADLEGELGVEIKSTPGNQPLQSIERVWS